MQCIVYCTEYRTVDRRHYIKQVISEFVINKRRCLDLFVLEGNYLSPVQCSSRLRLYLDDLQVQWDTEREVEKRKMCSDCLVHITCLKYRPEFFLALPSRFVFDSHASDATYLSSSPCFRLFQLFPMRKLELVGRIRGRHKKGIWQWVSWLAALSCVQNSTAFLISWQTQLPSQIEPWVKNSPNSLAIKFITEGKRL